MRTRIILSAAIVLALGLTFACTSTVPATVTLQPTAPIKQNSKIYVLARSQRPRVMQSLVDAGFRATDELSGDGYSLEVKIGGKRGTQECGTVNNVVYIVNMAGSRVMVIKGRGATGSCKPNVFDDMSRKLASFTPKS